MAKKIVRRVLKDMSEEKSTLSDKDWTGIISVIILCGYFGLIATKYYLSQEITELDGIGAFVGLIVGWYLRGKV